MSDTPKEVLQEQFSKVYRHLMAQRERSISVKGCAYRGDNGLMCAAGVCIPDSEYDPRMETNAWDYVCTHFPGACEWLDQELGVRLQRIHDREPVSSWSRLLDGLAKDFKLEVPQ